MPQFPQRDDAGEDRPGKAAVVRVEPSGHDIIVEPDESLLAAALHQGYRWPTLCHGAGECTTCFVKLLSGAEHVAPASAQERARLAECGRDGPDVRLACQLEIHGPISVLKRGLRRNTGGDSDDDLIS
ncbi:MAG: 2Fe-2S iron-sulfur cluster-binding protein [Mycobacterium sp.]